MRRPFTSQNAVISNGQVTTQTANPAGEPARHDKPSTPNPKQRINTGERRGTPALISRYATLAPIKKHNDGILPQKRTRDLRVSVPCSRGRLARGAATTARRPGVGFPESKPPPHRFRPREANPNVATSPPPCRTEPPIPSPAHPTTRSHPAKTLVRFKDSRLKPAFMHQLPTPTTQLLVFYI